MKKIISLLVLTVMLFTAVANAEEEPCRHEIRYVPASEATCTDDGFVGHYECVACGRLFSDELGENEISTDDIAVKASHALRKEEPRDADCEEYGVKASHYVCDKCGGKFYDELAAYPVGDDSDVIIPATGHDWGEWETVKEPTEYQPGVRRRFCNNTPEEKVLVITLDAGHGPEDNKGVVEGYNEGRMMYYLMCMLEEELNKYAGVEIHKTREKLTDAPDNTTRGELAVTTGSDVFLSLHSNYINSPAACGVSLFRSFIRPESEELGMILGRTVSDLMNEYTKVTYLRGKGPMIRTEDAFGPEFGDGVTQDYYRVIRESVRSEKCRYSFIIEHGFHSNPAECEFIFHDENLRLIAVAEAKVFADYFGLVKRADAPESRERHVQYEEISALAHVDDPVTYDLPDGMKMEDNGAFGGGTHVAVKGITKEEAYENAPDRLKKAEVLYAFSYTANISTLAQAQNKDVTVSYKTGVRLPENAFVLNLTGGDNEPIHISYDEQNGAYSAVISSVGIYAVCVDRQRLKGDIDENGAINNKDVVMLFRILSRSETVDIDIMDFNEDGRVNNKDVVTLFRAVSKGGAVW